jgi:prepilin-type N-terminal cleavage/methylation domain-containing protein
MSKTTHRGGFTLIELVFAIALLGFMLTITLSTFIGVFRFYNWSNTTRQSQQQARTLLETLTREIRLKKVVSSTGNSICLRPVDQPATSESINLSSNNVVMQTFGTADCSGVGGTSTTLNGPRLVVQSLSFGIVYGAQGIPVVAGGTKINPTVVIGLNTIIGNAVALPGGGIGCATTDNFCSTAKYNTAVNGLAP